MKTRVLILAGAVAFDLGVMVVTARAQTPPPTTRSTGPAAPGQGQGGTASGLRVFEDLATIQARPAGSKHDPVRYLKIDSVNTTLACRARQGEVVVHERVQQCRIPAGGAPAIGNPSRNHPVPPLD